MIVLEDLTEADKQRSVIYTNGVGEEELGHITTWNLTYVFVDYGNSCGRGIATNPNDLHFTCR